jgi:hypothetical protein
LRGRSRVNRTGLLWQRRPSGDGAGACSRLRVIGDPWESSGQLDSGRKLALLIEDGTDRGGSISLGNDEHPNSMAADKRAAAGGPNTQLLPLGR